MKKRALCTLMAFILCISPFIQLEAADHILYASDGRTINVSADEVDKYLQVGWYTSAEDAKIVTVYASDGRTLEIANKDREAYNAVGWYNSAEEAEIVTVYAMDGRTLEIINKDREAYNAVGWYNTLEEVTITMYATDGRTITVFRDLGEAYKNVGWYYNIADVSVTMYDENGGEHIVYLDNIESSKSQGLHLNKSDVMQLMFADDGRTVYVPFSKVSDYLSSGWYRGGGKLDPSRPMLALTFDDGPGKYTDKVLSCLEKYGARATFYVVGKSVSGYKETLRRAVKLGCEIGNHTWSHVNLASSGSGTIASQIASTNTAVFNATGIYPKTYRPPYGAYNSGSLSSISMPAIMWSVDTLDWKTRNASKNYQSAVNGAADGAIILMHDIHSPTADSVTSIVPALLKKGYQLVTVSELLQVKKGGGLSGKVYNSAK